MDQGKGRPNTIGHRLDQKLETVRNNYRTVQQESAKQMKELKEQTRSKRLIVKKSRKQFRASKAKVKSLKKPLSADIKAVVVIPDKPMSTNESRAKLPKNFTMGECVSNLSHAAFLTACFFSENYELLRTAAKDVMHEQIRMQSLPELFEARKIAYENGALLSTLSGSGSSFLNIVYAGDAANLKQKLQDKFKSFRVEIFNFDNDGIKILQS